MTSSYDTNVHRWVIQQVRRGGLTVLEDPVTTRTLLSQEQRTLRLQPGLDFQSFLWVTAKAHVEIHFPGTYTGLTTTYPLATTVQPPRKRALHVIHGGAR